MFNPITSPYWYVEERNVPNMGPNIKIYTIRPCPGTTPEKAKEAWAELQKLCEILSKSYDFSTHHKRSSAEHTLIVHQDFLDPRTRAILAEAKLIPPITPPPPVSEK